MENSLKFNWIDAPEYSDVELKYPSGNCFMIFRLINVPKTINSELCWYLLAARRIDNKNSDLDTKIYFTNTFTDISCLIANNLEQAKHKAELMIVKEISAMIDYLYNVKDIYCV